MEKASLIKYNFFMASKSLEIHGIALDDLREYLLHLGGELQPDGTIMADGWSAEIASLPDYLIGRASFCSYLVKMEGEEELVSSVWQRFKLRILRPGG